MSSQKMMLRPIWLPSQFYLLLVLGIPQSLVNYGHASLILDHISSTSCPWLKYVWSRSGVKTPSILDIYTLNGTNAVQYCLYFCASRLLINFLISGNFSLTIEPKPWIY